MTQDAAPAPIGAAPPAVLAAIPSPLQNVPDAAPSEPAAPRKSRSGTSGAERRRRAAASGTAPAPKPRADKTPAAPKLAPLDKRLTETIDLLGTLVGTFVDPYDGAVLCHNADKAGKTLAGIAARKPAFGRTLERLLSAGDNVDGLALLAGMLLPILCHHGILPAKYAVVATVMGTAPPAVPGADDAAELRDLLAGMKQTAA